MTLATEARVTRTAIYRAGQEQWCDEPVESSFVKTALIMLCSVTNASGTVKRDASPRLFSSWLDQAWLETGTVASRRLYRISAPTNADSASPGDKRMAVLEAAAIVGNIAQFTEVYRSMNLDDRSANDVVSIVQLALSIGAIALAEEACKYGLTRFPNHDELKKMSTIFEPPRITVSRRQPPTGTRANTQWLTAHGDDYRGKWVALRAGTLIASASSIDELLKIIGDVKGTGIFIAPVH
jgi:hypothetical protein